MKKIKEMSHESNPCGDGLASSRKVDAIIKKFSEKREKKQNKTKLNIKQTIKNHYPIMILLTIALIINLLAFFQLGYKYSINSDDLSYINSGLTFLETGKITMHGVLSAQIMPGLTFLIALFALIFGKGAIFLISLKIFWIIMGVASIFVLYKIMRLYTNKFIAIIPCLFLLAPDFIWTNNVILTETPFMLTFMLLTYYSLRFVKYNQNKDYYFIILWFIICLFIRPSIGLFPLFLVIILLIKKYDWKDLLKKCLIAGTVLILVLIPWIYRNYKIFDKFIPLTYGMGNPLLLGTYQGYNFPLDEELDYVSNVNNKLSKEMKYNLYNKNAKDYMRKYAALEYDGLKAKYRMQKWWEKDKVSMLKSYLVFKPKIMLHSSFYWDEIFGINDAVNILLRKIDLVLFLIATILIFIKRRYLSEFWLLMFAYGYHIVLYSYSFAYGRYALTLFFLRFIVIGLGIDVLWNIIKERQKKNESISNNTSL